MRRVTLVQAGRYTGSIPCRRSLGYAFARGRCDKAPIASPVAGLIAAIPSLSKLASGTPSTLSTFDPTE